MRTGPKLIGDVLGELASRRGFAGVRRACLCDAAWREAVGEQAARYSRAGPVRRGRLEITVANSTWLQELSFQKPRLLNALAELLPDEKIVDLRFRVGSIDY
jgi:predicted nucleic acid-binding Zn ribbon protein